MSQESAPKSAVPTFSISATADTPTRTTIQTRGFEFAIDEPESLNGSDTAPNPVEYLIGSLAGCLNVVCHVIAEEYEFEIDELDIAIEGQLDPAKFLGTSNTSRAGYQNIEVTIDVQADVEDETLAEWLHDVEKRCPVTDNLSNSTPVDIVLSPSTAR